MSLSPGTRFSAYEIVAFIGAGGMGEVYRARDTRLKREVAIKILPDAFANDPDRLARFQREAELLATLNHPNIGAVYGLEQTADLRGIVLELIDGETLADRISHGPLPIESTVNVARQIAEALEAAHQRGVIHRDLKPANIKITGEDRVKVLDFGLAKAMEGSAGLTKPDPAYMSQSPTLSMMATQAGIVLGTAAYMSPEQAKGLPADQRSDIFSFGTVLYEMLTARQPFQGETAPDVLASVLVREPDVSALPSSINPRLIEVVRRCLEKNPKKRWQAIGDVRVELELIAQAPRVATSSPVVVSQMPLWKRAVSMTAVAIGAAVPAAFLAWNLKPAPPEQPARFSLMLDEGQQLAALNRQAVVAISPDGASIVYAANTRLFLRRIADLDAVPIAATDTIAVAPAFSPDGQWIVFGSVKDRALKKIAAAGGTPITLTQIDATFGINWIGNDIVAGLGPKGVVRVPAAGGSPQQVVDAKPGEEIYNPRMLPDGETLIFTVGSGGQSTRSNTQIVAQSIKSGERKLLITAGADARYVPTGHLLYIANGVVLAVPFDAKRVTVEGTAAPVIEGVAQSSGPSAAGHFSVSDTGSLVYVPGRVGGTTAQRSLVMMDRARASSALNVPPGLYEAPRFSPDGRWVAVGTEDGKDANIWIADVSGGTAMRRLTFGGRNRYPVWSRDGQMIAYQSDREGDLGIFMQRADGTAPPERLSKAEPKIEHRPESWSPDGAHLTLNVLPAGQPTDSSLSARATFIGAIHILDIKKRSLMPFLEVPGRYVGRSAFSPDGKWVAYSSNETGRFEIYVQPFPATGSRFQVGSPGTLDRFSAWWSSNGKELIFAEGSTGWSIVSVTTHPSLAFGTPRGLTRPGGFLTLGPGGPKPYDISADGEHIVATMAEAQGGTQPGARPELRVVLKWFEELKQRVPIRD